MERQTEDFLLDRHAVVTVARAGNRALRRILAPGLGDDWAFGFVREDGDLVLARCPRDLDASHADLLMLASIGAGRDIFVVPGDANPDAPPRWLQGWAMFKSIHLAVREPRREAMLLMDGETTGLSYELPDDLKSVRDRPVWIRRFQGLDDLQEAWTGDTAVPAAIASEEDAAEAKAQAEAEAEDAGPGESSQAARPAASSVASERTEPLAPAGEPRPTQSPSAVPEAEAVASAMSPVVAWQVKPWQQAILRLDASTRLRVELGAQDAALVVQELASRRLVVTTVGREASPEDVLMWVAEGTAMLLKTALEEGTRPLDLRALRIAPPASAAVDMIDAAWARCLTGLEAQGHRTMNLLPESAGAVELALAGEAMRSRVIDADAPLAAGLRLQSLRQRLSPIAGEAGPLAWRGAADAPAVQCCRFLPHAIELVAEVVLEIRFDVERCAMRIRSDDLVLAVAHPSRRGMRALKLDAARCRALFIDDAAQGQGDALLAALCDQTLAQDTPPAQVLLFCRSSLGEAVARVLAGRIDSRTSAPEAGPSPHPLAAPQVHRLGKQKYLRFGATGGRLEWQGANVFEESGWAGVRLAAGEDALAAYAALGLAKRGV